MKFMKPASALLAAAMLASSVGIVSYAEEDKEMKQALTIVKERIDIPEELSELTYSTSTEYGKKYYRFNWDSPDMRRHLQVRVCGKIITEYSHYDYGDSSEETYTFAKLTKEEVVERAKEELERLNPTVAKNIAINEDGVRISLYSNYAGVPVFRVRDGIRVAAQSGQINIDKNTGELLSYHLNWIPGAGFGNAEEAISKEEAIAAYREVFPLKKSYLTSYDWETKEYTPHLVIERAEIGQIDAFTGKKATFEDSYDYYENDIAADESYGDDDTDDDVNPGAGGGVSFTDQELEKLELEGSLVKPEKALADMIASRIWSIPQSAEINENDSYTYFDEQVGAYVRSFKLRAYETEEYVSVDEGENTPAPTQQEKPPRQTYAGNVTINAETGEILSFSGSDTRTVTRAIKSEEQGKNLLNGFLRKILNERAGEFILDKPNPYYMGKDREGNLTEDSYINTVAASSPRYAYGIPSDREKVSITVDQSGRVSRYDITWLGLEYPKPEKILSDREAYDRFFEQTEYELLYRVAYNRKLKRMETALVYNAGDDFRIDAFSGKLADYQGREIPADKSAGYTDLDRSGCREEAEKLMLYGVTLMDENGRLNADMTITRSDFQALVRNIGVYSRSDEDGEKPLTRRYAAKILAGYSYTKIAELPGLFKSPYSDVPEDDKYVGYIALASAQEYIKGENGKFRPSAKMTRGDALTLVYDYLSR